MSSLLTILILATGVAAPTEVRYRDAVEVFHCDFGPQWDQSFDGITNIVDVYVRHLRNKVDDVYEHKLIHTVRGVGYTVKGAHS